MVFTKAEMAKMLDAPYPIHGRFLKQQFGDLNATTAAIKTGHAPKSARQQASRRFKKADSADALKPGQNGFSQKVEAGGEKAQSQLEMASLMSFTDTLRDKGCPMRRDAWPRAAGAIDTIRFRERAGASSSHTDTTIKPVGKLPAPARNQAHETAIEATYLAPQKRFARTPILQREDCITALLAKGCQRCRCNMRDCDAYTLGVHALLTEAKLKMVKRYGRRHQENPNTTHGHQAKKLCHTPSFRSSNPSIRAKKPTRITSSIVNRTKPAQNPVTLPMPLQWHRWENLTGRRFHSMKVTSPSLRLGWCCRETARRFRPCHS
jgi:hypothetical protein